MDINQQYGLLASQLGDVVYKLVLLEQQKEKLLQAIKELDALAAKVKAENEAKNSQAEEHSAGSNSPT